LDEGGVEAEWGENGDRRKEEVKKKIRSDFRKCNLRVGEKRGKEFETHQG